MTKIKNAAKSEKQKCKYCDKYFTKVQLASHKCSWEPRQCKYCHMQIIARDIDRHEEKCASKQSKKKDDALKSLSTTSSKQESSNEPEDRCCSFGDCDCSSFVPSTSSRVRPSHPHLICATCGHGALYHQSAARRLCSCEGSIDGIKWAKEFQAAAVDSSPKKSSAPRTSGSVSTGSLEKESSASSGKNKSSSGKVPIRSKGKKSALMQVAESMEKDSKAVQDRKQEECSHGSCRKHAYGPS